MDPRMPFSVHRIRRAVQDYKDARRNIYKSLKMILANINRMDAALSSIHKDLLDLNKPMFDQQGNLLPEEEKGNVFSKILRVIGVRIKESFQWR